MKTLEEIERDVGKFQFERWHARAEREYAASPYIYKGEDAHHAYVYAIVSHIYDNYKKMEAGVRRL